MSLPEPEHPRWNLSNKLAFASLVVALVSLVATLLVTCFTAQISIDITKQLSSHPETRIQKDNIALHWDNNGIAQLFESDRMTGNNGTGDTLAVPAIYFTNIGNDIALDVEVDWMLLENLDDLSQLADIEMNVLQKYPDSSMELDIRFGNNQKRRISEQPKKTIGFITPNSASSASFPISLLEAITFYCYNAFPQSDDEIDYSRSFREIAMPSLRVLVSYKNALDETVQNDLIIKFRVFRFERHSDGSGYCKFEISAIDRNVTS